MCINVYIEPLGLSSIIGHPLQLFQGLHIVIWHCKSVLYLTNSPICLFVCRIAECFSFLVCTKWSNSIIHQDPPHLGPGGLPIYNHHTLFRPTPEGIDDGSTSRSDDDESGDGICGRQDIGGHLLKLPILLFQILLCMKLEVIELLVCVGLDWRQIDTCISLCIAFC